MRIALCGAGLIDALAAAFKARGLVGFGRSNMRNYRQIALTWPALGIGQTVPGELSLPAGIHQTLSGESVPAQLPAGDQLPWQDQAWMQRLRRELSFSQLLELSRTSDPLARAFYEVQALGHRWNVRELKRQRDSMLFDRVGLSCDPQAVLALADAGQLLDAATANVRDPYVLEFLNLPGAAMPIRSLTLRARSSTIFRPSCWSSVVTSPSSAGNTACPWAGGVTLSTCCSFTDDCVAL